MGDGPVTKKPSPMSPSGLMRTASGTSAPNQTSPWSSPSARTGSTEQTAGAPPDRILGGAGGEEPRHGPPRRGLPGAVHDPGQGRQISQLFDIGMRDAGIEVVLSGVRMPRMNSIMERRVQTCRRELLDRTLIWNQRHLLHALREFEDFYNGHRPHQGIANARPLHPLPTPINDPDKLSHLGIRRHDHLGGILHEYQHAA